MGAMLIQMEKRLVPVRQHRRLPDGSIPPLPPFLTVVWEYRTSLPGVIGEPDRGFLKKRERRRK